jgi:hypothetical protein
MSFTYVIYLAEGASIGQSVVKGIAYHRQLCIMSINFYCYSESYFLGFIDSDGDQYGLLKAFNLFIFIV